MTYILIPVVSAVLYRVGGMDQWEWCFINQKLWRWLGIGIAIGLLAWSGIVAFLLTVASYVVMIQAFPYGSKSWLNFLGQYGKHFVSGFAFGVACWPIMGIACIWSAMLSGFMFYVIERNGWVNPFAELGRGFFGTLIYAVLWLLR